MPDESDDFDFDIDLEGDLARAETELAVRVERRRYGKPVTIVSGFDTNRTDLKDVASTLKKKLGTGGTVEDETVELQGDQRERVRSLLEELGFAVG